MPELAELLVTSHAVEPDAVEAARQRQSAAGGSLEANLLALGRIDEPALKAATARVTRTPLVELTARAPDPAAQARLGLALCRSERIYPLVWEAGSETLWVAVSDPTDQALLDRLTRLTGVRRLRAAVAGPHEIRRALDRDAARWGDTSAHEALRVRVEGLLERQGRISRIFQAVQSLLAEKGVEGD